MNNEELEVERPEFQFSDIVLVNNRDMQTILNEINLEDLLISLVNIDDRIFEHVLKALVRGG